MSLRYLIWCSRAYHSCPKSYLTQTGSRAGSLLAAARLGQRAWHSATDFGASQLERSSIAGTNSVGQGVVHTGTGGHSLLVLPKLYMLDEIKIQSRQLVDVIIDVLAGGAGLDWKKLMLSHLWLSRMLQSMFCQSLRTLGVPMNGLWLGLAWPVGHGDLDPRAILNGVTGATGTAWDGSDLAVVMDMVAMDHFDLLLPRSFIRSMAWRNHNDKSGVPHFDVDGTLPKRCSASSKQARLPPTSSKKRLHDTVCHSAVSINSLLRACSTSSA